MSCFIQNSQSSDSKAGKVSWIDCRGKGMPVGLPGEWHRLSGESNPGWIARWATIARRKESQVGNKPGGRSNLCGFPLLKFILYCYMPDCQIASSLISLRRSGLSEVQNIPHIASGLKIMKTKAASLTLRAVAHTAV